MHNREGFKDGQPHSKKDGSQQCGQINRDGWSQQARDHTYQ